MRLRVFVDEVLSVVLEAGDGAEGALEPLEGGSEEGGEGDEGLLVHGRHHE